MFYRHLEQILEHSSYLVSGVYTRIFDIEDFTWSLSLVETVPFE
jgi:hypothetical protein